MDGAQFVGTGTTLTGLGGFTLRTDPLRLLLPGRGETVPLGVPSP